MTNSPVTNATEESALELTDAQKRRQRMRNIAIGLGLAGLVVLFYVRTMIAVATNIASHH